jgi:hypothetical protein
LPPEPVATGYATVVFQFEMFATATGGPVQCGFGLFSGCVDRTREHYTQQMLDAKNMMAASDPRYLTVSLLYLL